MKINFLILFILMTLLSFSQERTKVGLVLSGGGAKGLAHIGVLKELEKKGIKPDYIVGTSIGALIGGLYSIGYSADQIKAIILDRDWDYLLNDKINRANVLIGQDRKDKKALVSLQMDGLIPTLPNGLNTGQNVLTLINILTRDYNYSLNFDDLPIPFRCVATNIETGEQKIFSRGKLSDAMRASMSIPSVFTPYEIGNNMYVDGGLVNNFPTDIAKEMGADIIIGVDVGAVLYKKEEINSIVKILDQSASFYNARVTKKNKELCDIYLRPNINGISILAFEDGEDIIKRGSLVTQEISDELDAIIKEHPEIKQEIILKEQNHQINIQTILIKSSAKEKYKRHAINKLVFGKLKLKPPCSIDDKELCNRINQVYGSEFFEKVSMSFEKFDSSYVMTIDLKEKKMNNFDLGMRYDGIYGVNIMMRAEFRSLFAYGSLLEVRAVIGQSPHLKLRYSTDRGNSLGLGTSFTYDNFDAFSYDGDIITTSYSFNRAAGDVFIHSNIGNFNRVVFGIEGSAFALSPFQTISDIDNVKESYLSIFFTYTIDNWDKSYYPTRGMRLKMRADGILDNNGQTLFHSWIRGKNINQLSKRFTLIEEAFVGVASQKIDSTLYRFELGGLSNNRIQWYNSFPGLRFLNHGSNNIWVLKAGLQYEFVPKNYLTYTFGAAAMDQDIVNLMTYAEQFYTGMSLKYGFDSMFGPLELSIDYGIQSYQTHLFVSLGYWF